MNQEKSNVQYDQIIANCRNEFEEKNKKYGNSLNAYDAFGVLQKVFIKLFRIKSIQEAGKYEVKGETIEKEIPGIINYCLYGICAAKNMDVRISVVLEGPDLFTEYDNAAKSTRSLFQKKNHDYGEAWRQLSVSYMTQESLSKYMRMYTIYGELKFNHEKRDELAKEFLEVFSDICNYMIFSAIRISEGTNPMI